MKRIFLIGLVALTMAGCSTLQLLQQDFNAATASATNPVTKEDLYKFESGFAVATLLLDTYRKGCLAGAVDVNCRSNIAKIQPYTRQIPPYLSQLRLFVKNNDQVNAHVVLSNLTQLYSNMKTTAANLGVNLGS